MNDKLKATLPVIQVIILAVIAWQLWRIAEAVADVAYQISVK